MSLQAFLDSRETGSKPTGKNNGGNKTIIEMFNSETDDPKASLLNWGSSMFDNVSSQLTESITKIQATSLQAATAAGQTVGVVDEEGQSKISLFAPTEEDPILKLLTKKQRIFGFLGCILGGMFCFSIAASLLPVLVVASRKFALLFTLGSLFFIISFSLLKGPVVHMKQLAKPEKLPFTITYFGSLVLTLYTAMALQSYFLTIIAAGIQLCSLVYFFMSYIPGGVKGITMLCKTMGNICVRLFPV